jgi:hypothetical protein
LTKNQHYLFAFEAIPIIFHSETNHFMEYLERDGIKFLQFWWDHVGDRLDQSLHVPFEGIKYEVQAYGKDTQLVMITLPPPMEDLQAYFIALLAKPERRFGPVRIPNTRAFALRRVDNEDSPHTVVGELTPRGIFIPINSGIDPTPEAFQLAICDIIRRKQK